MAFGLVSSVFNAVKSVAAPAIGIAGGGATAAGGGSLLAPVGAVAGLASGVPLVGDLVNAATDLIGIPGGGGPVDLTGWSGGNGTVVTRTTVETMDVASGQIVRIKRMPGTPYLMNNEVTAAKRVIKKNAALTKRVPRKTVRESPTTQLKNSLVARALQNVNGGGCAG